MKALLTTILFLTSATLCFSQKKFGNWYERKVMFGLEIDAALAFFSGQSDMRAGIGGGLVVEYAPSKSVSFALNGRVIPYFGTDNVKDGNITLAPVILTPRIFLGSGFFVGPKAGISFNIDADTYTNGQLTPTTNSLYGFGIGFRSTRQKMNVELAYVAHKLPWGDMNTFEGCYRYYFLRNLKKSQ